MSQHFRFDASRSLTALEQDSTIIAVIEMSQTKWLVAALVPGIERQPLKKFDANEDNVAEALASLAPRSQARLGGSFKLSHRWERKVEMEGTCSLGALSLQMTSPSRRGPGPFLPQPS
jgi:hypothetical protein